MAGPLDNLWLRRQLAVLMDADVTLRPGESKPAIVAFRDVKQPLERVTIVGRCGEAQMEVPCVVNSQ